MLQIDSKQLLSQFRTISSNINYTYFIDKLFVRALFEQKCGFYSKKTSQMHIHYQVNIQWKQRKKYLQENIKFLLNEEWRVKIFFVSPTMLCGEKHTSRSVLNYILLLAFTSKSQVFYRIILMNFDQFEQRVLFILPNDQKQ